MPPYYYCPFLGNGFVSIVSINRTDRTTPFCMQALSYSFLTSCIKTGLNRAVSLNFRQETTSILPFIVCSFARDMRNPTPENPILHPILHPKTPVNTWCLGYGCRKCSFFQKLFFQRGETQRSGSCKTSDFFEQKYRCFASKVRMFASKKSDVFVFR